MLGHLIDLYSNDINQIIELTHHQNANHTITNTTAESNAFAQRFTGFCLELSSKIIIKVFKDSSRSSNLTSF